MPPNHHPFVENSQTNEKNDDILIVFSEKFSD